MTDVEALTLLRSRAEAIRLCSYALEVKDVAEGYPGLPSARLGTAPSSQVSRLPTVIADESGSYRVVR